MPTPQDALNYAKRFLGSIPVDSTEMKYRILDDAHKKLWTSAPWRWSVGALVPLLLVNDQQVYTRAAAEVDISYVLSAWITNGDERYDVSVIGAVPVTTELPGRPSQLAFELNTPNETFTVLPVPKGYADDHYLMGYYKKTPVTISAGNEATNYATSTGVPDQWFWVYQEIVLAKAMAFINHARTGSVTYVDGKAQFTGQLGVVEAAIQEMREREPMLVNSMGGPVNG